MSFLSEANRIADELRAMKLKYPQPHAKRPTVELRPGAKLLTTREASAALNRKEQTLRGWACRKDGPINPVRINGRLGWNPADVERLLNGE